MGEITGRRRLVVGIAAGFVLGVLALAFLHGSSSSTTRVQLQRPAADVSDDSTTTTAAIPTSIEAPTTTPVTVAPVPRSTPRVAPAAPPDQAAPVVDEPSTTSEAPTTTPVTVPPTTVCPSYASCPP